MSLSEKSSRCWLLPAFAVLATLLLAACGGGGSSSAQDTFSISASSLSFSAARDGPFPASQVVQASFKYPDAAYVAAAYPPGVPQASWLTISPTSVSGDTYTFTFAVNSTNLSPGTYTTTIGLGVTRRDTSVIAYKYVDISYTVRNVVARLTTNLGEVYIWPGAGESDVGLLSFQRQVVYGVYDNTLIHRVVPGYVIQGGEYDAGYNPVSPVGTMSVDSANTRQNNRGTVGITKTSTNNSPGFFFNLDNNNYLDFPQAGGFGVVGILDSSRETQESVRKILEVPRTAPAFDGPDVSARPTTHIKFFGNLSRGNSQTVLDNVTVYDVNGDPRTLTILFVNNVSTLSGQWFVTVTDATNAINQTGSIQFQLDGRLQEGHNVITIANPPVNGGVTTSFDLYFGEPGSYTVTNFSGGYTSDIKIIDIDGMPRPDGKEQPQQQITIQKAELLGSDLSLPAPSQTTLVVVGGNLYSSDAEYSIEFGVYLPGTDMWGRYASGFDRSLRLLFRNQGYIQEGQWSLALYWFGSYWDYPRLLQFDANGHPTPSIVASYANWRLPVAIDIGNIKLVNSGGSSSLSVSSVNGNSYWNQYVPLTPAEFRPMFNDK